MIGLQPNEANFKSNIEKLAAKLDVYEQILGKQKYLAGDVRLPPLRLCLSVR